MLPACLGGVVVEIVTSTDMLIIIRGMIVIEWSALILGIEVLRNDGVQPAILFQLQLGTQQPVLEGVDIIAMRLFRVPLITLAITRIADVQHRRVVLEEALSTV